MIFSVTRRDITHAPVSGVCPVNAAMQRRIPTAVVNRRFVWVGRRRYDLPDWVSARIDIWDKSGRMVPFRFTVNGLAATLAAVRYPPKERDRE